MRLPEFFDTTATRAVITRQEAREFLVPKEMYKSDVDPNLGYSLYVQRIGLIFNKVFGRTFSKHFRCGR